MSSSCGFRFRLLGRRKLGAMIDRTIELAVCAADAVGRTSSLELVHGASLSTVVFRYVPARQGLDADGLNAALRQRLFDRGIAVIGHTRVRGRQCLKLTCMNPAVSDGADGSAGFGYCRAWTATWNGLAVGLGALLVDFAPSNFSLNPSLLETALPSCARARAGQGTRPYVRLGGAKTVVPG